MKGLTRAIGLLTLLLIPIRVVTGFGPKRQTEIRISDSNIVYSPYNWYRSGSTFAQTPNPGTYVKVGFTGTKIAVDVDASPITAASVPASQYPVVRYSVDGGPPVTTQLTPATTALECAKGLAAGNHTLSLEYVAGYVFLDFWTPVNVLRVTGFSLDEGGSTVPAFGAIATRTHHTLFLGDSITNGDDDTATFAGGITNAVDTQDATVGYPAVVAAGIGAEYGVVAYGGASWEGRAADGHTPGIMKSYSMLDSLHSRLIEGKLSPIPNDIFINLGENVGPSRDDVPTLLKSLRAASSAETRIWVIIPFSGRSRSSLNAGFAAYQAAAKDRYADVLDLGNCPYLPVGRPTMFSVDGQHPLANLHAFLGAQLVQARADKLARLHG